MPNEVQFEWDDANREHVAAHTITPEEAEEAYLGDVVLVKTEIRGSETRTTVVGQTGAKRIILVVTTPRQGRVRVVTAWPAKRKWRNLWITLNKNL